MSGGGRIPDPSLAGDCLPRDLGVRNLLLALGFPDEAARSEAAEIGETIAGVTRMEEHFFVYTNLFRGCIEVRFGLQIASSQEDDVARF